MRKTIIVTLIVVILLSVFGGIVYAQSIHEPMEGQKLVSWGNVGIAPGNKNYIAYTMFSLNNPDCINQITIDKVSVFKYDATVIYEGPPLVGMQAVELTTPLEPHQTIDIQLPYYILVFECGMDPNPSTWPADPKDYWPDVSQYTIEVFWSAVKDSLPLTGWAWMPLLGEDEEGNYTIPLMSNTSQMINMEQISIKSK